MRKQSRFIDELRKGWWHHDVRPAVSRAAYAAIAHAVGDTWAPGDIERALGKASNRDMKSEGLSNKFRKIWKDQTVPSLPTLSEVTRAFPACQAEYWSEHPIFFLLDGRQKESESFAQSAIHYALDSLNGSIRMEVWKQEIDYEPWTGRLLKSLDNRAMLDVLGSDLFAELDTLDRLTLSTAFSKMALATEDWPAYDQAVWVSYLEFDTALVNYNPLLIGWKWLAKLYEEQLWRPHNTLCRGAVPVSGHSRANLAHFMSIAKKSGRNLPPPEMFDWAELIGTTPSVMDTP
ncbi:hypothetical protein [Dyella agri]|uniref:Uncharacterized protein n=1 Tax=Dyella agri TaxID=1926869 RepID=A0ABW8KIX9_9GAMM